MKTYSIGDKKFVMPPLTLLQRRLANPVFEKLRNIPKQLAGPGLDLQKAFTLAFSAEEIYVSGEFPKFLATILVPENEKWDVSCIEKNAPLMDSIDEDTQTEVLRDFLIRKSKSTDGSTLFTMDSPQSKNSSSENEN